MNTKQLRQKILDLAIRGKLVPQDPDDEPASVLLERVRAEKERLIKAGKIKRDKNDSVVFRDEDKSRGQLPDEWVWCRLGDISAIVTDGEHLTPRRCKEYCGYYLLSARNILDGAISLDDVDYVDDAEYAHISRRCNPQRNDVLISCSGSVGRVAVVNDDSHYVMVRSAAMVRPIFLSSFYIMFALQSGFLQGQITSHKKQVAQANLFQAEIKGLILPLPPLAEQKRIASAIESAFSVIDEIERNKTDLQSAVAATKSKILSLAIRGKLVPQDPNDEPASVLLERIRAEREMLIKQGKIKRNKNDSTVVKSDNSYYENLPQGWLLVRLDDISGIIMGQSPSGESVTYNPNGIEFHQGKIYFTDRYLARSGQYTAEANKVTEKDSVLLCVRAPVGIVNIADRNIAIGRGLCAISPLGGISIEFVFHWLTAFQDSFIKQATGTTFMAITTEVVRQQIIPLPALFGL